MFRQDIRAFEGLAFVTAICLHAVVFLGFGAYAPASYAGERMPTHLEPSIWVDIPPQLAELSAAHTEKVSPRKPNGAGVRAESEAARLENSSPTQGGASAAMVRSRAASSLGSSMPKLVAIEESTARGDEMGVTETHGVDVGSVETEDELGDSSAAPGHESGAGTEEGSGLLKQGEGGLHMNKTPRNTPRLIEAQNCSDLFPWNASRDALTLAVEVKVQGSGAATMQRIVGSNSPTEFRQAASLCARRLRFLPALDARGRTIASSAIVRLHFSRSSS